MRFIVLCTFFQLIISFLSISQERNQFVDNQEAIKIYDQILATRNPNMVIEIIDKINIENVIEDSLKSYFYYYKGSAYGQLARFDSAIFYVESAEEVLQEDRHPLIEIQILRAFGNINWARNFYHTSLKNYEDALNISYELKHAEFQISLLGNIAGIYAKLENLPIALEYAIKAEEISDKTGVIRPRSHMKIGTYLNDMGEYEKALTSLHKTQKFIRTEGKDSIALGVNYINIATSHLELGRYQLTAIYLDSANSVLREIGVDFPSYYFIKIKLAIKTNDFTQAKSLLKITESIVIKQEDMDEMKKFKILAKELAMKEKRLNDAIRFQEEIYVLNDSIKTDKMLNRVYELQTQYETERKEAEIQRLTLSNALKDANLESGRNKQYGIGIGSILSLITLAVFFSFKYKKEKAEREAQELQVEALKKRFIELHSSPAELAVSLNFNELNKKLNTPLTEREFDALKLSLEGKSNTEIADQLFISVSTVKFHLRNTYSKIGVGNRKEAFQYVLKTS